jgi:hypothetical protein
MEAIAASTMRAGDGKNLVSIHPWSALICHSTTKMTGVATPSAIASIRRRLTHAWGCNSAGPGTIRMTPDSDA